MYLKNGELQINKKQIFSWLYYPAPETWLILLNKCFFQLGYAKKWSFSRFIKKTYKCPEILNIVFHKVLFIVNFFIGGKKIIFISGRA